jgi:predicted nucleic acid-binding protein
MIVVDASIAAEWYVQDRHDAIARASLIEVARSGAAAPGNFWAETLQALLRSERRKRLERDERAGAVAHLAGLDIIAVFPALSRITGLAEKYSLSAYDAGYLAVATQRDLKLATLDVALAEAAKAENCLWTPPPPEEVEKKFSLLLAD